MEYPYADWRPANALEDEYLFDQERADYVINFIEEAMILSSGFNEGQRMKCLEWQREVFTKLFGTIRWSDELERYVRQYRSCNIWIPRKNGKTTVIAAIAIYLLSMDIPGQATILCGALTAGQAQQIFKQAKGFIKNNKWFDDPKIFKVRNGWHEIEHVPTGSILKVVAQGDDIKLGSEPTAIIIDELAVQKNPDFINSLRGGQSSTAEPLLFGISTAGYKNRHKYGFDEWSADRQIFENQALNKRKLVFMRPLDDTADWEDEEVWRYANPSIGEANSIEFLRGEYEDALLKPHLIPHFKAYYLNIWSQAGNTWIDMKLWHESGEAGGDVIPQHLEGRRCYGGLDLSSKKDMTAWVLLFPGSPSDENAPGYTVLARMYATQWSIDSREDHMKYKLKEWADQGHLTIFPGEEIQFDVIRSQIIDDYAKYDIEQIGIDKWQSRDTAQILERELGMDLIDVPQSPKNLGEPVAQLETVIISKKLYHGFNPVLTWNLENVVATPDKRDRLSLGKVEPLAKIDGIAALVNAFYVGYEPEEQEQEAFFIPASDFMNY